MLGGTLWRFAIHKNRPSCFTWSSYFTTHSTMQRVAHTHTVCYPCKLWIACNVLTVSETIEQIVSETIKTHISACLDHSPFVCLRLHCTFDSLFWWPMMVVLLLSLLRRHWACFSLGLPMFILTSYVAICLSSWFGVVVSIWVLGVPIYLF